MIVLWFVLGILIAFGIARYNESNKLFWQLTLAFVLGYALTVMCTRTFGNEESDKNPTQVLPTQVQSMVSGSAIYLFGNTVDMQSSKVTASTLVSQVYTPALHGENVTLSEVFGRTRDQPIEIKTEPPELCLTKVSLTHHDG